MRTTRIEPDEQATSESPPARRLPGWAPFVVLALTTAVFTLPHLGNRPFWLDEAYTIANTRDGVLDILVLARGRMIAYYVMVSPLVDAPLQTFTWLRLPSAVAAIGAPLVFYPIARRIVRVPVAFVASMLLALHPLVIEHGQEARSYTIVLLLALISWYSLIRLVESTRRAWVVAMAVSLVAAGYFHLVAFALLPAQLATLAYLSSWRRYLRPLGAASIAVALAALPLAVLVLQPSSNRASWIPPFDPSQISLVMSLFGTGPSSWFRVAWIVAVGVGLILSLGPWARPPDDHRSWLLAIPGIWLVVPIAVVSAMSLVNPLMHYRYVLFTLPAFILLAAVALDRIPIRGAAVATLALFGVGLLGAQASLVGAGDNAEQWPALTCALSRASQDAAIVFPEPRDRIPVDLTIERDPSCTPVAAVLPAGAWGVPTNDHIREDWDRVEPSTLPSMTSIVWRDLSLTADLRAEVHTDMRGEGFQLTTTELFGTDLAVEHWARIDPE